MFITYLSVNRWETEGRWINSYQSVFYLLVSTSNPTTRYESLWRKMNYFIRLWTIENSASLACSVKTKSIIFISQIQMDEIMFITVQRHWKFLQLTMACPCSTSAHWILVSEIQIRLLLSELGWLRLKRKGLYIHTGKKAVYLDNFSVIINA